MNRYATRLPIFLFFIKVATSHRSPYAVIWNWKFVQKCGRGNCLVTPQMWQNFWVIESCLLFVFLLLYPAEYIWKNTSYVFFFIATVEIICDCIMINMTLMFYHKKKKKLHWCRMYCFSLISCLFSYSPFRSVCLQLRRLLWIRTQWGIIWFVWWVAHLSSSNISSVNCQNISFYFLTLPCWLHLSCHSIW